jgi:hypothetical protein
MLTTHSEGWESAVSMPKQEKRTAAKYQASCARAEWFLLELERDIFLNQRCILSITQITFLLAKVVSLIP